ncbi:hypothetical protein [Stutzerimonas nitrititolerans]|uniref:hypothetical protein n=1 Tax=Stutzerimonas nitrititolerans TaxID=2482751 RepID=UPI0028B11F74|nr:hypothetical protein [Stutzerimonas nitrititolerans]
MDKVLVDRELKPCPFCGSEAGLSKGGRALCSSEDCIACDLFVPVESWNRRAQPAEAEGVEVTGFLYKNNGQALTAADMDADTFALMARSDFDGEVEKLVRQTDHLAALSAVTAERDRLESTLIQTTTRHFAKEWKDHADDKKLDECLSEGIAMLEAERDQLRAEVEGLLGAMRQIRYASNNGPVSENNAGCIRRIEQIADAAMAAKEA